MTRGSAQKLLLAGIVQSANRYAGHTTIVQSAINDCTPETRRWFLRPGRGREMLHTKRRLHVGSRDSFGFPLLLRKKRRNHPQCPARTARRIVENRRPGFATNQHARFGPNRLTER